MYSRTGSRIALAALLGLGPMLGCSGDFSAAAGGWKDSTHGIAIDAFPSGWNVHTGEASVALDKQFNKDGYGYAYAERMSFAVTVDDSRSLDEAAAQLARSGYLLQDQSRVRLGAGTLPLWIFFHQANAVEVSWVAITLRSGLAYTFEVRGTPLDRALLNDFKIMTANFHFLPEARQEAWDAIEAHQPAQAYDAFERLVAANAADGNAVYGLGLAELALGKSKDALAHLKQADTMIGLGEARQAIGQAYLQSGDPVRAAAVWYQMIFDDPDQEEALRPSIANALAAAPVAATNRPLPVERQKVWEDFAFFGDLASIGLQDDLTDARSGDFDQIDVGKYQDIDDGLELLLGATLQHLAFEGGDAAEAHHLAAAFTFRQAMREAITAIRHADLEQLEKAGLEMREGLEANAAASSRVEAEE